MTFEQSLIHELTQLDARESKRERHVNFYRLGIYLNAVDTFIEDVNAGATRETAFANTFVPTRGMHTVARKLLLDLDVQHGQWIIGPCTGTPR